MTKCNHCNLEFDLSGKPRNWMANHSRWCKSNPLRSAYLNTLSKTRDELTKDPDLINKRNLKIKSAWETGKYDLVDFASSKIGRTHSVETKIAIKNAALASDHRRLKKSTSVHNGVILDSSWEVALANRLDELNIMWIRPSPIKWKDCNDIYHNYFPDFYLPDHNVFIDPKNPHAMKVQKEKIDILNSTYSNIIWLTSLSECRTFSI